ncbi:jg12356 [Pararge aegeria aegeria]|uniref:Jg12356 protein n=1 Tax=Pararge aegeria aegeria TaxID=348720 RepID=A0A8S4RBQ4_9NEOP|nr:jg12356 [Pararge aegeria aegeria]
MEAVTAQCVGLRLHFTGAQFQSQREPQNIVRKPVFLRVLHNVLKGVLNPPIYWAMLDFGLNPFSSWEETRSHHHYVYRLTFNTGHRCFV